MKAGRGQGLGIAARMKEYRLSRLWTLRRMAAVVGIDPRTAWNIENGRGMPSEIVMRKISRALPGIEKVLPPTQKG